MSDEIRSITAKEILRRNFGPWTKEEIEKQQRDDAKNSGAIGEILRPLWVEMAAAIDRVKDSCPSKGCKILLGDIEVEL